MYIFPRNQELVSLVSLRLKSSNIWLLQRCQISLDNYLINLHYGATECLEFDSSGTIIDGYVTFLLSEFLYNGKSFYELLGGDESKYNTQIEANPI